MDHVNRGITYAGLILLHAISIFSFVHVYKTTGTCSIYGLEAHCLIYWSCLIITTLYCCYILHKVYSALVGCPDYVFKPSERDVGYLVTPGKTKRDIANMVRKRRKVGDIPPPYPNGWYEVMRSCDLPVGASKAIYMNGVHLAVFRNQSGHASVIDAYCPHLGANLGVGGSVIGNCIKCPFHGWEFDGETGQCTSVPYSTGKVPSFAKVKVWPSMEVNGLIMFWYDAEGREPQFTVPEISQIKSGRWVNRGRSIHYINCHLEDISENGADLSHLKAVHEIGAHIGVYTDFRNSTWLGRLITHEWTVNWEQCPPPRSHVGHMTVKLTNKLFGRWSLRPLDVTVSVDQIGPGIVLLYFDSFIGSSLIIQTDVPEEPLLQRLTHYVYCNWWVPTFIATWILLAGDAIQVERDALVWVNKRYVGKPTLVKEDNLILAHRRWFQQFYSENSVKMTQIKDSDLTW